MTIPEKDETTLPEETGAPADAEAAAGFDAVFSGDKRPAPTPAPTPAPSPAPTPAPSPTPAPEAAPAPSPKPAEDVVTLELRKLHGRIGALNDELLHLKKAKESGPGNQPATLTKPELKRLMDSYPDLAKDLSEDLAETLAGLAGKQPAFDPKEVETIVKDRVTQGVSAGVSEEMAKLRADAVTDAHPTWKTDLWVDGKLGDKRTPQYEAWLKTMTPEEAKAFESNNNPYQVTRSLQKFYDWQAAAAKAEDDKRKRLQAAVQPTDGNGAGPKPKSDREAEIKGFDAVFNSS